MSLFKIRAGLAAGFLSILLSAKAAAPVDTTVTNPPAPRLLSLEEYLQDVINQNDTIRAQMYEAAATHRKARAEYGAFEPQFDVSASREANRRTNNVQQQAAQSSANLFDERNNLYDAGVDTLIPIGGKVSLGYTVSDLYNNVNPYSSFLSTTNSSFTKQYETFVGATYTQPLLKNAGLTVTLAPLRLAALDSDIAYQQYRRQLMLTVSRAESAYWNLYFAQQQLDFYNQSVKVSQQVLDDSRQKLQFGQGSELDVMEAQSGLALRQTKRNEAMQDYYDALATLLSLTGNSPAPGTSQAISAGGPVVRATDQPAEASLDISYQEALEDVASYNPDYLVLDKKIRQEELRLKVARNQLLPELDVKGAYGFNGLGGRTQAHSLDSLETQNLPSWSVGVQLTVPLFGDIKARNMYHAAQLALEEANCTLRDTQTQIANHLDLAIQKTRGWQQSIQSYQTVVHFNEELLKTQSERLKAGTIDADKLLQVEADLLDSRQQLANALVQYRRALIDRDLTTGAILKHHNLEITRDELRRQFNQLKVD